MLDKLPTDVRAALPGLAVGAWQALRAEGNVWRRATSGGLCATVVLAAAPWAEAQPHAPGWLVLIIIGAFAVPLLDLGLDTIRGFPLRDLLVELFRRRITRAPMPGDAAGGAAGASPGSASAPEPASEPARASAGAAAPGTAAAGAAAALPAPDASPPDAPPPWPTSDPAAAADHAGAAADPDSLSPPPPASPPSTTRLR